MKIIDPTFEILSPFSRQDALAMLRLIETCGRTCYKSEGAATADSAPDFVRKIARSFKHESIIEHGSVSVRFVVDRGVSHEIVRHRLAAYSQESTRYCNYSKDKFGNEITFIRPPFFADEKSQEYQSWAESCATAEDHYLELLILGATPQEARSVLPNSLKTELVMTANLRVWRHVFTLRTSSKAHPQMQQIMRPLLARFQEVMPELFDDIIPA